MRLLYLAGPYSAPTPEGVAANVAAAVAEAKKIATRFPGIFPVVPHTFSGGGDWGQSYEFWLAGTMEVMRRCDAVLMLSGWGHSKGAQEELREAERLGKPVLLDWNDLGRWAKSADKEVQS